MIKMNNFILLTEIHFIFIYFNKLLIFLNTNFLHDQPTFIFSYNNETVIC
jgi:hypothetical protein